MIGLIQQIQADSKSSDLNIDMAEAGMGALSWARKYAREDVLNFFILITDDVMHTGGQAGVP